MHRRWNVINKDCFFAMYPSTIMYAMEKIVSAIITIFLIDSIESVTDAVFSANYEIGFMDIVKIVISIIVLAVVVPVLHYYAEKVHFSNTLKHDRIILGRYFDKSCQDVKIISEGEAQYRLENDPNQFRNIWQNNMTILISFPCNLVILLVITLRINILLTVITIIFSLINFFVPVMVKNAKAECEEKAREYHTDLRMYEMMLVEHGYLLNMWNLTHKIIQVMKQNFKHFYKKVMKKDIFLSVIQDNMCSFLEKFCMISILLVGSVMVSNQLIPVGTVVAMTMFFSVYYMMVQECSNLVMNHASLQKLKKRMFFFYDNLEDEKGKVIEKIQQIECEKLSAYYEDKNIFDGKSFEIMMGKLNVIWGRNGCGKTTFLEILCGINSNYSGQIKINGMDISQINRCCWREKIAYVEQDGFLFSDTFRNNIVLDGKDSGRDLEEIDPFLEGLHLSELYEENRMLDNKNVSGGEKQKISIVRALISKRPIIVMDEPNNNLDVQTIKWVKNYVKDTKQTIILVTHDRQFLEIADNVVCFEDGVLNWAEREES